MYNTLVSLAFCSHCPHIGTSQLYLYKKSLILFFLKYFQKRVPSFNYTFSNQFSEELKFVPNVSSATEKQHVFTLKYLPKR